MTDHPPHDISCPNVLVLMATRNGSPWLGGQLASLLAQDSVKLTILASDDASTDDTLAVLNSVSASDSRLKVLANPVGSGSAGANFRRLYLKAEAVQVDYVALADQDDIWFQDKLSTAIQALHNSGASGYSAAVEAFWPEPGRTAVLTQSNRITRADFLFEGGGQGCTFVLTGDFFRRVQTFCRNHPAQIEQLHYHDWLLYLLARTWSLKWFFDERPSMRYRQHENNEIGARGGFQSIIRRIDMITSGWYRAQIAAACGLYAAAKGSDPRVQRLCGQLGKRIGPRRGVGSRFTLAAEVLLLGRRRLADRVVLSAFALADKL